MANSEPEAQDESQDESQDETRRKFREALERKAAKAAEAELEKLTAALSHIDRAMFDPSSALPGLAKLTMSDLMKRRGEMQKSIAAAELAWLEASEALEEVAD